MSGWYVVYILLCFISPAILISAGLDAADWQYWVECLIIGLCFSSGQHVGSKSR